jgi:hypothetical protein
MMTTTINTTTTITTIRIINPVVVRVTATIVSVFKFVLGDSESVTLVVVLLVVGSVCVWLVGCCGVDDSPVSVGGITGFSGSFVGSMIGYYGSVCGGYGLGLFGLLIRGIHVYLKNPIAVMSGFSLPLTPISMLYSVKFSIVLTLVVLFTPFLY